MIFKHSKMYPFTIITISKVNFGLESLFRKITSWGWAVLSFDLLKLASSNWEASLCWEWQCSTIVSKASLKWQCYCQTPVQAHQVSPSRTRSWLCFPPVTTRTRTRTKTTRTTLTKIYQNEVCYKLRIWNIDLTPKLRPQPPSLGWSITIPRLVNHSPKDQPSNSTRSLTLVQPSLYLLIFENKIEIR